MCKPSESHRGRVGGGEGGRKGRKGGGVAWRGVMDMLD